MSWKFNPPPGWPQQPEGWVPPPGWTPDPSWPAPPAGWQFWVPASAGPTSAPPADNAPASTPPASTPPASTPPAAAAGAGSPPSSGAGQGADAPGAPPTPAQPSSGAGQPTSFPGSVPVQPSASGTPAYSPQSGFGGGGPAFSSGQPAFAGATPHQPAGGDQGKAWFAHWWAILVLAVLLVLGLAAGFGGTRVALDLAAEESTTEPTASGSEQTPTAAPEPSPTDLPFVPSEPPIEPPSDTGGMSEACGEVAVIFLGVTAAGMEEVDDLDEYLDGVVEARRDAAAELREVATDDSDERDGLDTLADELDDAAQQLDDNRRDIDEIDASFEKAVDAYFAFNDAHC